jgi:hypothetical protein
MKYIIYNILTFNNYNQSKQRCEILGFTTRELQFTLTETMRVLPIPTNVQHPKHEIAEQYGE